MDTNLNPNNDDKLWAALAQGLGLVGWGLGGLGQIIGPLVIYLAKKDSAPFVAAHARESLNFQITALLAWLALGAAGVLSFITVVLIPVWLLVAGVYSLFLLVVVIIATIKAAGGEPYEYPLCLRLVK